jgi:hypothetical protein
VVGPLIKKISIPPGINRDSTQYASGGSWYSSNNVRFRGGYAESIGGWADSQTKTTYQGAKSYLLGVARGLFSWTDYSSNRLGCVGTNWKFYAIGGITAKDITPIRLSVTSGVTFAAVDTSDVLTVSHTAHGAVPYDFVTYSNAVSLGGLITATVINGEHQITEVVDDDSYKITVSSVANGSDTGNGAGVDADYQINVGQADQVLSAGGWGDGPFDSGTVSWDYASPSSIITDEMRRVSIDNYNEDLMISNRGGPIYYYDVSENIFQNVPRDSTNDTRAQVLSSFVGDSDTPVVVDSFLVSERDGHVIAFGCNDIGSTSQNNLLVRWSDQNNPFDWTPTASNTSGGQMLRMGSRIMNAVATKSEILIWTNSALYSMRFIGPPDVFSFNLVSGNVTIVSPMSVVNTSSGVYYMGEDGFYVYTGSIRPIPSPVSKLVFDDINMDQAAKAFGGSNSSFDEIYWAYPSRDSFECDKYVCFNHAQNTWYMGSFDMSAVGSSATATGYNRTAWEDSVVRLFPSSTYIESLDKTTDPPTLTSGIVLHELNPSESSVFTGTKECFVESGDIDISDGDSFTFISRFIPDLMIPEYDSDTANPSISFSLTGKDFPGGTDTTSEVKDINEFDLVTGAYSPTGNSTAIRLRGRSMSMKFSSSEENFNWRLGENRVDGRPDGGR